MSFVERQLVSDSPVKAGLNTEETTSGATSKMKFRATWLWMTANAFAHQPAHLRLLPSGLVQWNGNTPHGSWHYDPKGHILYVSVHCRADNTKTKKHMFRSVPGADAWAHIAYDVSYNVMLLPQKAQEADVAARPSQTMVRSADTPTVDLVPSIVCAGRDPSSRTTSIVHRNRHRTIRGTVLQLHVERAHREVKNSSTI